MKQTNAPKTTPSPTQEQPAHDQVGNSNSPSAVFVSMALDMSWRLAIVVLVPIIGGFELDKKLDMTPLLTIVGFLLAMVGTGLVMWRTLQVSQNVSTSKKVKRS